MPARPVTRSRTATAANAAAGSTAAARSTKPTAARTTTARSGLADITNRANAGNHQPTAGAGAKPGIAADKKPRTASTTAKPVVRATSTTTTAGAGRPTATARRAAAPANAPATSAAQAARATVRRTTSTARPKVGTASDQAASTTKSTTAPVARARAPSNVTNTTAVGSHHQRSVKRAASRSDLAPEAKKPRLECASSSAIAQPVVAPAPVAPVRPKDEGWEDLDEADKFDPIMVVEYADDVFDYLKVLEIKTMPTDSLLKLQTEIKWSHRSTLVDWLINLHYRLRMLPETLFVATNLVDRTLSMGPVPLSQFQLLGTTCLFTAAKYEETFPPDLYTMSQCGGELFGEEDLRVCERDVLRKLDFDLSHPTPMSFLRRISKADEYDVETRTLAKYLVEIGMVDWRLLAHPPSVQAAAAFWLARWILERGDWGPTLVHYSTYAEDELLATAEIMLDYVLRQPNEHDGARHPKFYKKYSGRRFYVVAPYVRNWAKQQFGSAVMTTDAEPEVDDPIAVDLFTDRGYVRPNAQTLMRIFGLVDPSIPEDDGGLAPMPYSPQRATAPAPLLVSPTTGDEPMTTSPMGPNGGGALDDGDAEMTTASFLGDMTKDSAGQVSEEI